MMFETGITLEMTMPVLVELAGPLHVFMATGSVIHSRQVSESVFQVGVAFHELVQGGWDLVVSPSRTSEN
jgi:hypothetical protein